MLSNLVVENYALISKLEIEFRKGLTIITGETGAGKSILLGALSLILGKRADTTVLLDKEKKCIVEGTFEITGYKLQEFFEDHQIDYSDQPIIRREILVSGKSRAFINDTPVNLELLTDLGNRLIDIHSQHQNLNLSNSLFQLKVLDSFAQCGSALAEYRNNYYAFREAEKNFTKLSEEAARSKADLDYLQFQFNQLEEAKLREGEQEELEQELQRLTHAEEIKIALTNASSLFQGDEMSILQQLKESHAHINHISKYLDGNPNLASRIDSVYIEIKDIAHETELFNNQMSFDPERLALVNDRLNIIYNLQKKHRLSGLHELIELHDNLKEKIETIQSYDTELSELEKVLTESLSRLKKNSIQLSELRRKAIPTFEKRIISMLMEVGIPNGSFAIQLDHADEFATHGADHIQFLFSANKNMKPQEISRVASGGEISRLMLCIKSLMSDSNALPTIIFDEIDTGVSGDIAERVGNIINRMADKMQIINITHLPQVASKGKYHYLVYKTEEGETTQTQMRLLSEKERQLEIAKMLSGEEITAAALENARALLGK